MSENTINGEMDTIVQNRINELFFPTRCKIKKIYPDNLHVAVETNNGEIVSYVETIGNNLKVGNTGILLFLDGNSEDYIVITK